MIHVKEQAAGEGDPPGDISNSGSEVASKLAKEQPLRRVQGSGGTSVCSMVGSALLLTCTSKCRGACCFTWTHQTIAFVGKENNPSLQTKQGQHGGHGDKDWERLRTENRYSPTLSHFKTSRGNGGIHSSNHANTHGEVQRAEATPYELSLALPFANCVITVQLPDFSLPLFSQL